MNMLIATRTFARSEERLTSLFLSATVRDMRDYRAKIPEWAQHLNININLQKYWSGALEPIEELCRRRLSNCSGYIGVFGYRYGWQPPGQERSITHIEFDHALSIWSDQSRYPPIFLFLPRSGSVASQELKKFADVVLANEFRKNVAKIKESRKKQTDLRKAVAGLSRLVNEFSSIRELQERITAALFHYHTTLLDGLREAESIKARTSDIPSAQLGRVGREPQTETIKGILLALAAQATAPGACLFVHGRESSGLAEFLDLLSSWRGWGRGACIKSLSPKEEDPVFLAAWIHRAIGERGAEGDPFEVLAQTIARLCERESLIVVIKQRRGWQPYDFQKHFWQPLYDRLLARWGTPPNRKPFVLVRAFANPIELQEAEWMQTCKPAQGQFDWARALVLPQCADLKETDVASWLLSDDLGLDPGRAARIAREAVRKDDGTIDGTPLQVFDRLQGDGFWEEMIAETVP